MAQTPQILVGDVGGTNTRLALASCQQGQWVLRDRESYPTGDISGMDDALSCYLKAHYVGRNRLPCCLSGAGPVRDNVCYLSNVRWRIDGLRIAEEFPLDVLVINDFSAICYGLPTLSQRDSSALVPIPHTDGTTGRRDSSVWAAVGAGTGLGIGYLVTIENRHLALPSEGGHADFAPFDEETGKLKDFVSQKLGCSPGSEQFVSGQGIVNIFEYLVRSGRFDSGEITRSILEVSDEEKPAQISRHRDADPYCDATMELFVRIYGKVASNAALHFLPGAGVYLAGGIAGKNESLFLDSPRFMEAFESNYKATVRPFLKRCPVFIVKDEAVALYGAAHAAEQFLTLGEEGHRREDHKE